MWSKLKVQSCVQQQTVMFLGEQHVLAFVHIKGEGILGGPVVNSIDIGLQIGEIRMLHNGLREGHVVCKHG